MDAALEEYLLKRRQPMALDEDEVEAADPGDMDRSLSPEPLALRERPTFGSMLEDRTLQNLRLPYDVGARVDDRESDLLAEAGGQQLLAMRPAADAMATGGMRKPLPMGRGVPAEDVGSAGGNYLDALRRAQRMDDLSAAVGRSNAAMQQLAGVTSRGAFQPHALPPMPSEVGKELQRRQAVAEYLKQKREDSTADVDARYKTWLMTRQPKGVSRPGLTQEQIDERFQKGLENVQSMIDARNRPRPGKPGKPTAAPTREERLSTGLRREFESQAAVKTFGEVQSAFGKVSEAAKGNSPASDLSMLYSYAKLLDPGSVVRESEFQTMAQTGAFGDKVAAAVKRLAIGERLTEAQRADFVKAAKQQFDVYGQQFDEAAIRYEALAKKAGVAPEDVVFRRKAFVESGKPPAEQAMPADKQKRLEELRAKKAAGTLGSP